MYGVFSEATPYFESVSQHEDRRYACYGLFDKLLEWKIKPGENGATFIAVPVIESAHDIRPDNCAKANSGSNFVIMELSTPERTERGEHGAGIDKWRHLKIGAHIQDTDPHHMDSFFDAQSR
jgi:hypothetical protein